MTRMVKGFCSSSPVFISKLYPSLRKGLSQLVAVCTKICLWASCLFNLVHELRRHANGGLGTQNMFHSCQVCWRFQQNLSCVFSGPVQSGDVFSGRIETGASHFGLYVYVPKLPSRDFVCIAHFVTADSKSLSLLSKKSRKIWVLFA
jgi:hypothetical protein